MYNKLLEIAKGLFSEILKYTAALGLYSTTDINNLQRVVTLPQSSKSLNHTVIFELVKTIKLFSGVHPGCESRYSLLCKIASCLPNNIRQISNVSTPARN